MTDALERLEQKLRQLFERLDSLESENEAFRALAGQSGNRLSGDQAIGQIERLKLDKEDLERKMSRIERSLTKVLAELDKLEL